MKLTLTQILKRATVAYVAFGVGIIVGSIIASTVAGSIFSQWMSLEDLECMNVAPEILGSPE